MLPEIWIVVLHYQGVEHTKACLGSLARQSYKNYRIVLVDNSSCDNKNSIRDTSNITGFSIYESLKDEFIFQYFKTPDNLGFAGGANAGINFCISHGAKWIWLLNNDTEVAEDALAKLVFEACAQPDVGVCGACLLLGSKENPQVCGFGEIDFYKAKTYERGKVPDNVSSVSCKWISGANMLFRAEAYCAVNGFDEKFFLYFEDVDICQRLIKSSWKCLFISNAHVYHIGNASTQGRLFILRSYYYTRNRFIFFLRHHKNFSYLPALFFMLLDLLRHCLVLPFRGSDGRRRLKAELLGWRDYFCQRLGKANPDELNF